MPAAGAEQYPLWRTYPVQNELDWLPWRTRSVRWTIPIGMAVGLTVLTGVGAGLLAGLEAAMLGVGYLGTAYTVLGATSGRKWARRALAARIARIARGQADLSSLRAKSDGELVHVRGRIVATETLPGFVYREPAVFRRVLFALGSRHYFFHEAAVHFDIIDESGERLPVQVHDARIVTPELLWEELPPGTHTRLVETIPANLGRAVTRAKERFLADPRGQTLGSELLVRPGDLVDVVGEKSRVPDFSQSERMHREMPTRAILRSGRALPLVVSPVR